ncbi:hypothetical protein B1219_12005 [Pseudomonas ogarae]|nr:hypothetical protein B1219_12005 [Pseudomonas ogarae]
MAGQGCVACADASGVSQPALIPLWERAVWEQSLLAIQALRSSRDRGVFIAGKPCSHTARSHS